MTNIKNLVVEPEMNEWEETIVIIPNKTRVVIIYPTATPEVVIIPIVSSIIIFPIVAFIVICCLRHRAIKLRRKARLSKRENNPYNMTEASCVSRFSPPISGARRSVSFNNEVEMTTTVELITPDRPDS